MSRGKRKKQRPAALFPAGPAHLSVTLRHRRTVRKTAVSLLDLVIFPKLQIVKVDAAGGGGVILILLVLIFLFIIQQADRTAAKLLIDGGAFLALLLRLQVLFLLRRRKPLGGLLGGKLLLQCLFHGRADGIGHTGHR